MEISQISDKNKIENILNLVLKSNSLVYLRAELNEYSGLLKEVKPNLITFYTKFKIPENFKTIFVHFTYLNKYFFFQTQIKNIEKNLYFLSFPNTLYTHLRRKSKRYNVQELDITTDLKIINLADSPVKDLIKSKLTLTYEKNKILKELEKDLPDINLLITYIIKEVKEYLITNEIKIILPIKKENFITSILKLWRKPLLIRRTDLIESYITKPEKDEYVTFYNYINFLREKNIDEKKITNFIGACIKLYKKIDAYSALYVPIFVSNLMPGYILAYNNSQSKKIIQNKEINYFLEAAEIIHNGLLKRKLNSLDESELNIKVVDISTEGIGLKITDPLLANVLEPQTKIKTDLLIEKKIKCSFIGLVKNKREHKDHFHIGVEICEIDDKNRTVLYNFINELSRKI